MAKKPEFNPVFAENRRARHDYTVLDTIECGIQLRGTEVKSVRHGSVSLAGAYGADEEYAAIGTSLSMLGIFITIPVMMTLL